MSSDSADATDAFPAMRSRRFLITIQEPDGSRRPFDAAELEERLRAAFAAAGERRESPRAGDLALAVEYALHKLPRREPLFTRAEVEGAVIRLLEESGFSAAARAFRVGTCVGAAESQLLVDAEPGTLAELLRPHLAVSPELFDTVVGDLAEAARKLGFPSAPPRLWLELARFYALRAEEELAARNPLPPPPEVPARSAAELAAELPPAAGRMLRDGVLRLDGVTPLFPCLHFTFSMERFAAVIGAEPPYTELELLPALYRAGCELDDARAALERFLAAPEPLPCLLSLPDLFDFTQRGAEGSESFALTLADALAGAFDPPLYKVSLG